MRCPPAADFGAMSAPAITGKTLVAKMIIFVAINNEAKTFSESYFNPKMPNKAEIGIGSHSQGIAMYGVHKVKDTDHQM